MTKIAQRVKPAPLVLSEKTLNRDPGPPVAVVETVETPTPVVETQKPRKARAGDRHADPKAHSAKTAARAKAKRAAAKVK